MVQPGGLIRDRYEALDVLGRGGQGEVYKALDHQHGRVVALKLRAVPDDDQRQALLAEARILLSLRPHPNLPLVREDFFWEDRYVLVMDWVEGTDMAALLIDTGDPGLPVSSVLSWMSQAAAALDHLHAQGVVHGDVKPANLVLTPDGRVVLVDFGISRVHGDETVEALGSPGYAAPELASQGLSTPVDVYGLAATAVALLTGAPPSGGRPTWDGVPNASAIERAIRRGLSVDPSRRPRSATELVERLRAHLALDLPTGVVTFLLTDIEGSTLRWEEDPDGMADLIARHDGLVADAVESAGGRLLKTRGEGDSTFSVFTRASDAATAALAAQRQLIAQTDLRVRMAIHSGEAETRDGDYFGRTVNRASRLRAVARGGQVLLSSAAADLVVDALPEGVDLVDLGYRELRDLARGEQVFALSHAALVPVAPSTDAPPPASISAPAPASPPRAHREPAVDDEGPDPAVVDAPTSPPSPTPPRAPIRSSSLGGTTPRPPRVPTPISTAQQPPPLPPALVTARTANFVGRRAELERLTVLWDHCREGERRLVLLAGEPGIGKTQLAIELAAAAHESGATVLHGRCDDGLQVPYQPFATALSQIIDDSIAAGNAPTLGRLAGELVRLVPDLPSLVEGLAPALRADAETEQYRLFDAVGLWLQAQAEKGPLVVVLDDLHWATRPTLHLLRHVLRSSEPVPLLIIGTYRDSEIGRGHPLGELLADLHRIPGMERLVIDGLGEDEVVDLLHAGAGHDLGTAGRDLARNIHQLTDGNPFFVRELLRHLVESGTLSQGADGRWTVKPITQPLGVPEGVREVVGRRLTRLSEATTSTLELAAVIGADFELDVLVAAGGFDEDDVLAALDEAVAARLVEESGPMRFRFAHAIVRATISDGLTRARRSRAHRRVAEAIEQRHADDLAPHLTVLAQHYAEAATAGDGTKAVEYATRAGDLACDRLAHEEAVQCYRLARDLLVTTAAPVDERTRCALLVALGEAERRAGDPAHRETLLEAAHLALRWRDGELAARAAIANAHPALTPVVQTDPERIHVLEGALALVGAEDSAVRSRLLAHLAYELTLAVEPDEAGQLADQALAVARRLDDPALLAEVLVLRSHTVTAPDALAERLALADQQLTLADELGDPMLEVEANLNGATAALQGGDIELVTARLGRARELAATIGQPGFRWQVLMQDARVAAMQGRFAEAEAQATEALEIGTAAGHADAVVVYGTQLAILRWLEGRMDEIAGLLRDLAASRPDEPVGRAVIALSLVQQGRVDEARRWYEPIIDAADPPFPENIAQASVRLGCLSILAGICAELADAERAPRLINELLPYRDYFIDDGTAWGGAVAGHLVRLYTLLGRFDDAESCVRQALAMYDRIGATPMVTIANTDWAELCFARRAEGDIDHGRRLLANVLAMTDRLGQRWHGDRARRLLDTAAQTMPPRPARLTKPVVVSEMVEHDRVAEPMIGRAAELERVERALGDAIDGATRIVLLSGEPGAGKTRMLDELGFLAAARGAAVLRGRSLEGTGEPYQPFIDALAGVVRTTPASDLPRLLGRLAPELGRLLPELPDLLPGSPEPVRSDPDTERYRLFDGVVGWLRATAAERPVVLLLDDLQWAGRPTLQLLRHVTRSLSSTRVVVAVAYRGTELGRAHPLSELLADLHRLPGVERVPLEGLSAPDVAALVAHELHRPLDQVQALAASVEAATTGNPFFVRELVRHLAETGAFDADAGPLGPATLEGAGVPEGVRALVSRRVGRLAPATRAALEAAAVIGDEIDITTLAAAVDLDEDDLLAGLDEAVAANILGEAPGLRPRYRFTQDIVRVTLLDAIDAEAQRALHLRVGVALETTYRDSLDEHLPELAHHFALAGVDPVRTVDYAIRLGERAMDRLADEEAAASFRRALDALDASPELASDDRRRADILVHLGEAQRRSADPDYRTTLFAASDLALRLGDDRLLARAAIANSRSSFSALGAVDEDRVALLRHAVATVGDVGSAERAILLSQLAVELMFSGDFGERLALSAEALAVARRLDDPTTLARVLASRIEAIGHASTFDERLRLNGEQLELASRLGDPNIAALGALNRYYLMLTVGDRAEADRFQRRATELGENSSQPMLAWVAAATSANQAFIDGRFDDAESLITEAFQHGQAEGQPDALVVYTGQIGVLRFFQGRLSELEGVLLTAIAAAPTIPALNAATATMLAELGRLDEARPLFEQLAADGFAGIPDDLVWLSGIALSAQVCHRLDDERRAEQLMTLLRPYSGRFVSEGTIFLGAVDRFLALLATTLGQWDDAERWFASALAGHEGLRAAPFSALTRADWATMLLRRGRRRDRVRAIELVEAAHTEAERLGMVAVRDATGVMLAELSQPLLPAPLGSAPTTFVGRSGELAHLRELLHKAEGGTRQLVLVAGEPGIGKTSLAAALGREAHAHGAVVLYGCCDEDAVVPLQPFVEVLRGLVADGAVGELPPDVVRLLPELDTNAARADTSDPTARSRLFDSLAQVLDRVPGERTMVLILDDLHWADQPTLLAVRHLIRRAAGKGLLVLGTYRDNEVSRTHPFADVLTELRRERLVDRIVLRGLSSDEVVELVAHVSGHELEEGDEELAVALGSAADGNPFFIEAILRHLVESGALVRGTDGRWDTDAASWDELGVPEGVREVIGRRLSRLSPTGEQVMAAGAVLGRVFSGGVVRRMVDADDGTEIDDALAEAVGLRLLEPLAGEGEALYAFAHALIRETLYDELSLPRRQRLHLRAADAIEAQGEHQQSLAEHAGALAVHLRQAGAAADPARAIEWSVRAAEAAFRVFAYEEAAGHFEGAVALLTELGGRDNDLRRARLHERLLKLRFFTGHDPSEGVRHGEAALEVYERLGEPYRAAMIHSQLGAHLATAGTPEGLDVARGLRHLEAAAPILGDGDDRATGYFHVSMANATVRALRLDDAERSSSRAVEIAEALGDRALWANAALLRGLALFERGQIAAGGALVEQALEAASEADSPAIVLLTAWNRGYQLLALDDPRAAEAMFAAQLSAPRFADAPRAAAALRLNRSRALFELGRLDELESGWTGGWAGAVGERFGANPDELTERLRALLAQQRAMGDVWTMLWHQPAVASVMRRLGLSETARTVVEDGIALAGSSGSVPPLVALRCEAALLDPANGAQQVELARGLLAAGSNWRALPTRVDHAEAAVLCATGELDRGLARFASAVEGYRRAHRPWAEADALTGWAAAAAAAGDAQAAAEHRDAARAVYARIGAARHWAEHV